MWYSAAVATLAAKNGAWAVWRGLGYRYGDGVLHDASTSRAERRPRPLLRTLLGQALRRRRLEQRRTLADVASDARVSVPYLSEVERGRKEASSEVLAAVCDALNIELSEVLTELGRDLAAHSAPVVRLDVIRRQHHISPPLSRSGTVRAHRSGDAVLLAA